MVEMYVCPNCGNKSFDGFRETYLSSSVRTIHNLKTGEDDVDIDYDEFVECVCLKCMKPSFNRAAAFIQDVSE